MALAPGRYRDIDATLQEIQAYLSEVAREIDEAIWYTNKQGHVYQMAMNAATQVAQFRHALQTELGHQHRETLDQSHSQAPLEDG